MLTVKNPLARKLVVIADDLTGASEVATLMLRGGKRCVVVNEPAGDTVEHLLSLREGVVCNLNSRYLSGKKAYGRINNFLTSSQKASRHVVYKKIDSTVRGNLAEEIDAVLDAECTDMALVCPALPRMGRITVGGYHLAEGMPVGRSFYAEGSSTSHLPSLLKTKSSHRVGYIDLGKIESGRDAICWQIKKEYQTETRIVVCDCCTDDDLLRIKNAILEVSLKVLPVGSAGLFEKFFEEKKPYLPSLIVCGSLNQATRSQLERLREKRECGYLELCLSFLEGKKEDELEKLAGKAQRFLHQGKDAVILATPEKVYPRGKKEHIAHLLAQSAAKLFKDFSFSGIIATGGDTAMATLQVLGASQIEITGEVGPLLPAAVIRDGSCRNTSIITKTGGFGSPDVFVKAVNYLAKKE